MLNCKEFVSLYSYFFSLFIGFMGTTTISYLHSGQI